MSILSFPFKNIGHPARPTLRDRFEDVLHQAFQMWRIHRADHAMHALSDEMLHDIGVSRSEIEEVTRHGRPFRRRRGFDSIHRPLIRRH